MNKLRFIDKENAKLKVEVDDAPHNPEFVAKIEKSMQEAKHGKVVKIGLDDIWKTDEDSLTPLELGLMKSGLKEALAVKEGKIKSIPYSELWDD